jgi:hypothetical protein
MFNELQTHETEKEQTHLEKKESKRYCFKFIHHEMST